MQATVVPAKPARLMIGFPPAAATERARPLEGVIAEVRQ